MITDKNRKRVLIQRNGKESLENYDDNLNQEIFENLTLKSDAMVDYVDENDMKYNDNQKAIIKTPSNVLNFDETDKPIRGTYNDDNEYKRDLAKYNKTNKVNKIFKTSLYNNQYIESAK